MTILVIRTEYFFSRRRTDEGSTDKFITSNEKYLQLKPDVYYDNRVEDDFLNSHWELDDCEIDGNPDLDCDGYNTTAYKYRVREIPHDTAEDYQERINMYNNMGGKA